MARFEEPGLPAKPELGRMIDLWRVEPHYRPTTALQKLVGTEGRAHAPAKREIARVSKSAYDVIEDTGSDEDESRCYIRLHDGTVYWAIYRKEQEA
jgi:hypothetical protein